MRTFTVVKSTYWNGETGREIREAGGKDAQLLGLYLLTNPHTNMIGLYYLPRVTIERELALSPSEITSALGVLGELGYAHYDPHTETVWVVEMAYHQLGCEAAPLDPRDKRLSSVHKLYLGTPANPFMGAFRAHYLTTLRLPERRVSTKPAVFATSINKGHPDARKPLDPVPDPVLVPAPDVGEGAETPFDPTPIDLASAPPLDAWFDELVRRYPVTRRSAGQPTRHAFVEAFQRHARRPAAELWADMLAGLANHVAGYEWRVKRMVPSLYNWLRDERWEQRHDVVPPTAIVSERTLQSEMAADAFVQAVDGGARDRH